MNKRVWIVVGVVVAMVVGWVVVGSIDSAPPDVSDLAVERPVVGDGEGDAFPVLQAAVALLEWPEEDGWISDYLAGEGEVDEKFGERAGRLVEANAGVVVEVGKACEMGVCIFPEIETLYDTVDHVAGLRQLVELLGVRGRWLRERGEWAAAAENGELMVRYGALVVGQPECLVDFLVGASSLGAAADEVEELACGEGIGEAELAGLAEVLEEVGELDGALARALRCEYRGIANTIDGLVSGQLDMDEGGGLVPGMGRWSTVGYVFHPNRTKGMIADYFRAQIEGLSVDWWEREEEPDLVVAAGLGGGQSMVRPNGVGRVLVSLLLPSVGGIAGQENKLAARFELLRVLVALRRFELAEGRAAAGLEELVPTYLDAVPADPFTGEPVGYDAESGTVSSAGIGEIPSP